MCWNAVDYTCGHAGMEPDIHCDCSVNSESVSIDLDCETCGERKRHQHYRQEIELGKLIDQMMGADWINEGLDSGTESEPESPSQQSDNAADCGRRDDGGDEKEKEDENENESESERDGQEDNHKIGETTETPYSSDNGHNDLHKDKDTEHNTIDTDTSSVSKS